MGDAIPANNQDFFIIDREVHGRMMTCPVCDAVRFRTYKELIYHLIWPPNCLNATSQRNQILEDNQAGPEMIPVAFSWSVILMVLWSALWVCHQLCYYLIAIPLIFVYNILASVILFRANLFQQAYGCARNAANVCVQSVRSLPGFFGRMYQNMGGFIAAFNGFILRDLSAAYHYILEIPYTYITGATVSVVLYIDSALEFMLQYIVDAVTLLIQAFNLAYQRNIRFPIVRFYVSSIEPWVDSVCHINAVTGRAFQQARHLIFVRFPTAIDRCISTERALVQRVFTSLKNLLRMTYGSLKWLNSAMYTFVYFPVDIPADTPFWKRFIYYVFFFIHVIVLICMCLCSYIQLAIFLMPNNDE